MNIEVSPVSPLLWVLLFLPHQSIQFQHHRPLEPRSREINYMWNQVNSLKPVSTWACGYTSKLLEASTKMLEIHWSDTHSHLLLIYFLKFHLCTEFSSPISKQHGSDGKAPPNTASEKCKVVADKMSTWYHVGFGKTASFRSMINMLLTRPGFTFM